MVSRTWKLLPIEAAPKDGRRVRLEAEVSSHRYENAFNGPVYARWDHRENAWRLSPYAPDTFIDSIEGWWPEEHRVALTLIRGESPGTVGLCYDWSDGSSRTEFVTPDRARNVYARLEQDLDEAELVRLTTPTLRVIK
jgi:hypothetical protein